MAAEPIIYSKLFEFDYDKKPFLMSGEVEIITRHLERVEESQEVMHGKMEMIEDAIKELKFSVMGNPPMGNKGLADRVEDIEDKIKLYDKLLERGWGASKAIYAVWILLGGFIGYVTTLVLKKFGL